MTVSDTEHTDDCESDTEHTDVCESDTCLLSFLRHPYKPSF